MLLNKLLKWFFCVEQNKNGGAIKVRLTEENTFAVDIDSMRKSTAVQKQLEEALNLSKK